MISELNRQEIYDVAVIGGGINGAGIARDAAGRGLKVLLCEKDDFGQHTSSASTKLIHGGLRYLENYQFKLVRHSLREREVLLRNAPHIIWPLRFVLPHAGSSRSAWMVRAGLYLYDALAPMKVLNRSKRINLTEHEAGAALESDIRQGFEYSDCWVQDSRLVILNVADAQKMGASVLSRTKCTDLRRGEDFWWITLSSDRVSDRLAGETRVRARVIVNAAGAWVDSIANQFHQEHGEESTHLVCGSHIVVPKLFDHRYAYIFQNYDRRVLFCIPYEREFTLIGTTEVKLKVPTERLKISSQEINYLCESVNRYLSSTIRPQDVMWSYTGVRVLYGEQVENASKLPRDYVIKMDDSMAPIVSVFGGKITTYRILAEDVLDQFRNLEGFDGAKWTHKGILPGGDTGGCSIEEYSQQLSVRYRWAPEELIARYACHYGTKTAEILSGCSSVKELGHEFAPGLFQAEVDYLVENEYAMSAEDVIWRRTRQGLRMNSTEIVQLNEYIGSVLQDGYVAEEAINAGIHN